MNITVNIKLFYVLIASYNKQKVPVVSLFVNVFSWKIILQLLFRSSTPDGITADLKWRNWNLLGKIDIYNT